jgi:hypothetical protein
VVLLLKPRRVVVIPRLIRMGAAPPPPPPRATGRLFQVFDRARLTIEFVAAAAAQVQAVLACIVNKAAAVAYVCQYSMP